MWLWYNGSGRPKHAYNIVILYAYLNYKERKKLMKIKTQIFFVQGCAFEKISHENLFYFEEMLDL